jgi:YcaO-like protein with predicted kinase domain
MARSYKDDKPISTITKIRNILSEIGVVNYESFWGQPYENVFSVRIDSLETEGCFGTNGKGQSRLYALASGYAEYIERLQNGFISGIRSFNRLFLSEIKKDTAFYFFPDEKLMTQSEFKALPIEYLYDLFGKKDKDAVNKDIDLYFKKLERNGFSGVLSVPFFDIAKKGITYLPYNINIMLTGSNGMAAGNSVSEGIFQAICELLERYASSIVFYERLTPPTINEEFLLQCPKEIKIIKEIKAIGYEVIVKDFSCNKGLPAVGVIIIDRKRQLYRLNVGADISFSIALSRALTEIHQGYKNINDFNESLLPIAGSKENYFLHTDAVSMLRRSAEFRKFIINSSGLFPDTLFGDKESYNFNQAIFKPQKNYLEDVKYLIQLVNNLGKNILIRDVSFLGFPSFYVYIPEISPIGRKTSEYEGENVNLSANVHNDLVEDLFFPFDQLINNKEKLQKLVDIFSSLGPNEIRGTKMCEILKLEFLFDYYWSSIPLYFFLTLFYFILSEYSKAIEYMQMFIDETDNYNDEYYTKVLAYFKLLEQKVSQNMLNKSIPQEIRNDFASPDKLFKNIDIPNCPNCIKCALNNNCLTKHKVNFSKRVLLKMKESPINQEDLKIFC